MAKAKMNIELGELAVHPNYFNMSIVYDTSRDPRILVGASDGKGFSVVSLDGTEYANFKSLFLDLETVAAELKRSQSIFPSISNPDGMMLTVPVRKLTIGHWLIVFSIQITHPKHLVAKMSFMDIESEENDEENDSFITLNSNEYTRLKNFIRDCEAQINSLCDAGTLPSRIRLP